MKFLLQNLTNFVKILTLYAFKKKLCLCIYNIFIRHMFSNIKIFYVRVYDLYYNEV